MLCLTASLSFNFLLNIIMKFISGLYWTHFYSINVSLCCPHYKGGEKADLLSTPPCVSSVSPLWGFPEFLAGPGGSVPVFAVAANQSWSLQCDQPIAAHACNNPLTRSYTSSHLEHQGCPKTQQRSWELEEQKMD